MRFGLIGAGAIGAVRASALARMEGSSLTAVTDLNEPQARTNAPQAAFVATAEALIAHPAVDAVIISTPPPLHEPLAMQALQAGKHVLIEKPMAASVEACQRMAMAAHAAGRLLTVGYNHRYFAAVKMVRDAVQTGAIGRLTHVRAYTGHTGMSEFKAPWMYDPAVMGGGTLMDNGTHIIDMVRYVMGDFEEVLGYTSNGVWGIDRVEDNALALMRSPGGVIGSIQSSWSEWKGYRFHIEAYGDRGMASAYYAPMMAKVITLDKPGGVPVVRRHFFPGAIVREKLRGWQSTVIQTFIEELSDFVDRSEGRAGSGRLAVAEDGIRAVQVAQAVYSASRTGTPDRLLPAVPAA